MIYDRSEAEAVAEILRVNALTQESFDFEGTVAEKLPTIKNESKNVSAVLKEQNAELTVLATSISMISEFSMNLSRTISFARQRGKIS